MPDKPKRQPTRNDRYHAKPSSAAVVVQSDQYGVEARREAYAALLAQGMEQAKAFRIIFPDHTQSGPAVAAMTKAVKEQVEVLKRQVHQGRAEFHGMDLGWMMGELKEMYYTALQDITPASRFCRKYKKRITQTDNGPVETIEVEKDAPKAILETIAELGAFGLPSQGSQAFLMMEERKNRTAEKGLQTMSEYLASLVQNGTPFDRREREVETIPITE